MKKSSIRKHLFKQIGSDSLFSMLESLQITLDSGTDLASALSSISEDLHDQNLKERLDNVKKDLESGVRLWESLKKNRVLPQRSIEIIKIGEESGMLSENLRIVVDQKKYEKELSSQIRAALIYPAIILTIGLVVAVGTLWFVLPRLTPIYDGLDLNLPITTKILIYIGENISEISAFYLLGALPIVIALLVLFTKVPSYRRFAEKVLFKTPAIGKIVKELEISRMGLTLGSLLNVGISIDKASQSAIEATPFLLYKDEYRKLHEAIISGSSFKNYFKTTTKSQVRLPATVRQMIDSGERSANLPYVFTYIGNTYKEKVKRTTQNLTLILEPLLLIIMWAFVSVIAISIILPIYTLIGSL